ncbi:MAG: D-alanyl-D-alanine carboxypeptidase, partial [Kiritimatiellae bacterium]|nr:D-alanyl-D-alanine carboxypeptidase [Kiritimatiellia bacterium]
SLLEAAVADDPLDEGRRPADAAETAALERQRAVAKTAARNPYRGAIAVDAADGRVLFQDNADVPCLPASMVKMMDLLLVLEAVERGELRESDKVAVSVRAAKTGGSQVFLDPKESFTLEGMLFALIVQSANDAAVAVAEHAAGSCEAMVARMNARAAELGMKDTRFHSVHGLPANVPAGQLNDVSTPRDMAILARELCRHPAAFKYTSCDYRVFRPGPKPPKFELRTHNPVLQRETRIAGADGLKTGFTNTAGYSLAASVVRNGRRVIVVTMGTGVADKKGAIDGPSSKTVRNRTVSRLVEEAFAK